MSGSWPSPRRCATAPACWSSASKFPERFYDVGIAESAAVDIAAGLAKTGMRPVVCIYSTFLQRSFDQIFQEVALQNLPVVFCVDRAGMVGADGATHHGLMDIGYLRMLPNMVLTAPADARRDEAGPAIRPGADAAGRDSLSRRSPSRRSSLTPATSEKPFELGKSVLVRRGLEILAGDRLLWDRPDGRPWRPPRCSVPRRSRST